MSPPLHELVAESEQGFVAFTFLNSSEDLLLASLFCLVSLSRCFTSRTCSRAGSES